MRDGSSDRHYLQPRAKFVLFMFVAITIMFVSPACCQTASTGALNGVTLDPSGAILPGVALNLVNQDTDETQTAISDGEGRFRFLFLAPGGYQLLAGKTDFSPLRLPNISVTVTETLRLELHLRLATVLGNVQVFSQPGMVQNDDSALGRVVNGDAVSSLRWSPGTSRR